MKLPNRIVLAVSLAAAVTASGCAREKQTPVAPSPPAAAQRPAPPGPGELLPSAESEKEERYREAIVKSAVNNPEFARLIPRDPTLGGSWRVGSKEDVHFLGNGQVALDYEDGHVAGRLVVKVEDPHDPRTWKVIRDEPK
jgi:hypothetical protein